MFFHFEITQTLQGSSLHVGICIQQGFRELLGAFLRFAFFLIIQCLLVGIMAFFLRGCLQLPRHQCH